MSVFKCYREYVYVSVWREKERKSKQETESYDIQKHNGRSFFFLYILA